MPFQDTDEDVTTVGTPRTPSRAERLLRKIFIEDWNLKLLALGITLALWFLVTGQNTPVNTVASVQLKFVRPSSLEISNDPPRTVDVLLSGSKHKLDQLDRTALFATVDISDQRAGERVVRLADRAQIPLLPDGIKVDSFQPSVIAINLEPVIDKEIPIEAKIQGSPADGFEVYAVRTSKSTIQVHGPASHVNAIVKAPTETISIDGKKESVTANNIGINIADPKVDMLDPIVDVQVEIGEKRLEKTLSEVTVETDPSIHVKQHTANITVLGPASVIRALKAIDVKIHLDSIGDSFRPSLALNPTLQGKVVLESVSPQKFVVGP